MTSCCSSISDGAPVRRVCGFVAVPGLGELLLLSDVDLSLFRVDGGICESGEIGMARVVWFIEGEGLYSMC